MAVTKELKDAVERMQAKDETAFATFYEQTYPYVYAKAKYVMHDEEDALDLTQETYIQAYKGIESIEDVNNVYAWLGGIVYRQGMRIFNKKKELLTGEEQDYLFEEMESGEATPEQAVEQQFITRTCGCSRTGNGEVETISAESVKKENGAADIDVTSSLGNRWFGSLMFLYDNSIRLNLSEQETEGSFKPITLKKN